MQKQTNLNLEQLAEQDPVSRPLAELQLEALRAASDPLWEECATSIRPQPPTAPTPVLHEAEIPVNARAVGDLFQRLTLVLSRTGVISGNVSQALAGGADPIELAEAAIEWDGETFERVGLELGIDSPVLFTLGTHTALPVLLSCGRHVMQRDSEIGWEPGYCPICGSWPLLAEQRGLDRQQWLRCGRCSAGWQSRHQRCIYCDNTDHTKLGYMAPEEERESRRAVTCDVCRGYFKAFTSVSPLAIADVLRHDLTSVEIDIAALDSGYERPDTPGFSPQVDLVPVDDAPRRWFPWR